MFLNHMRAAGLTHDPLLTIEHCEPGRYTRPMSRLVCRLLLFSLSLAVPLIAHGQDQPVTSEISADLGSCSATLTVTDADAKPILNAKVSTRVQYGLMGVKKLDLAAYTGVDGKVKIAHLPNSLKKAMIIHIEKGDKGDQVEFRPSERCQATFDVQLK